MHANGSIVIDGKHLVIGGRFVRIAKLRDEYYENVREPSAFITALKQSRTKADVFSFVQEPHCTNPQYPYPSERDTIALLPITTYEEWWKGIKDKSRNMVRKSQKNGVALRVVPFSDELVRGIMEIYNESPIRQGRKHWHYGKSFEVLKVEHQSFLDISDFIGAYLGNELVGFAKITHLGSYSVVMNIMSKICHRDKAPTNALIAKAIEICAEKKVPYLKYGVWGRRGLNDFKVHNGFKCFEVPRYFVPLNAKGALAMKLKLHRELTDNLPEWVVNSAAKARAKWTVWRYGNKPALAQGATK